MFSLSNRTRILRRAEYRTAFFVSICISADAKHNRTILFLVSLIFYIIVTSLYRVVNFQVCGSSRGSRILKYVPFYRRSAVLEERTCMKCQKLLESNDDNSRFDNARLLYLLSA